MEDTKLRIFLSYSRRDGEAADRIFAALEAARLGVFRDTEDILPAEDWRGRLEGLIGQADGVVFVMSPNSVRSEVCSWEVRLAQELNKRIVPVVISPVDNDDVPAPIERLNYIMATADRSFENAIRQLCAALTTDIGWIRAHTRIGERGAEWDRAGRPARSRILRGEELAEAEAWLAAQPDTAPPPTALQRAWIGASRAAAARRQRGWMTGALVVAAVSIGLGVFAEMNRRVAAEQRDRAERVLDRSSQTANDLVFDLARRFRDREGVPQSLVKDMLERSRALVDQLALAGESRPDLLRSRAAALTEMSVTLARQGDLDEAFSAATDASAGFAALVAAEPENMQWQTDQAAGLDRLGDILLALGRTEVAGEAFAESRAINQTLVQRAPNVPARHLNLAVSYEKTGSVAILAGRLDEALADLGEALDLREAHDPLGRGTAVVLERMGDAELAREQIAEAEKAYQRSLAITVALAASDTADTRLTRDLSVIHQKLGELLLARGDRPGALEHFSIDVEIARELLESDPDRVEWARDLMVSEDRLGGVYWQAGAMEDAAAAYGRAHAIARRIAAAETARTAQRDAASRAAQKLSLARFGLGDMAGALAAAETSVADLRRFQAQSGGLKANLAAALNNVSWYALFARQPVRALAAATEATSHNPASLAYALNHAHALMLADEVGAARGLYLKHEGAVTGGGHWVDLVKADFATFRDHGIDPPLIAEVLASFDGG